MARAANDIRVAVGDYSVHARLSAYRGIVPVRKTQRISRYCACTQDSTHIEVLCLYARLNTYRGIVPVIVSYPRTVTLLNKNGQTNNIYEQLRYSSE